MAFGLLSSAGGGTTRSARSGCASATWTGPRRRSNRPHQLGREPQPGLALLHLARGRSTRRERRSARPSPIRCHRSSRARLLPARVEIALASHDIADAHEAADELREIASTYDKPMLHAAAHQALGAALTYEEDAAAAIAELRTAVRHWTEADAPFEAAQARRWLAVAYRAGADESSAVMELRAAKAAFERLGRSA